MSVESFYLTGTGRIGSRWIAHALDAALPDWEVRHEQVKGRGSLIEKAKRTQAWFDARPKRGLADPRIHLTGRALRVDVKAVILRHPVRVWQSAIRRDINRPPKERDRWLTPDFVVYMVSYLQTLIETEGYRVLRFQEIIDPTTGPQAVSSVLGLPLDGARWSVPCMDHSPETSIPEQHLHVGEFIEDATRWFVERYRLEDI